MPEHQKFKKFWIYEPCLFYHFHLYGGSIENKGEIRNHLEVHCYTIVFITAFHCFVSRFYLFESQSGEEQRVRDKQTPQWVGSLMQGSNPGLQDHDLNQRQTLNQLSHPSTPRVSQYYRCLFIKRRGTERKTQVMTRRYIKREDRHMKAELCCHRP